MVQGWHRGEHAIQKRVGYDKAMTLAYRWIDEEMPEEHRIFHTTRLPFIPVTTLDEEGRPWSCILAGAEGKPGFVTSPKWDRLDMHVRVWEGDPFKENIEQYGDGNNVLIAGIGIEFSTRRRNKFAGHISVARKRDDEYRITAMVDQAIGNCPKYINIRQLDPHPDVHPIVVHHVSHLAAGEQLPEELIEFVRATDTIFIGSSYVANKEDQVKFPSHVGQNQRGGKPGFVRVRSDGRTIVVPDFSGNRLLQSLGNIEATPLASLTVVDFVTGDILYVTGNARNLVGRESQKIMPRQNVLTLIEVTGYTFVRDALPVRQREGTEPERSPYSPPVRLLAEESAAAAAMYADEEVSVTLSRIVLHSPSLATFTWQTSKPIHIAPGQTAILDFTSLVGSQKYAHMAPLKPNSVNDDRIRTWTVSSAHLASAGTTSFALTMREKPGGTVTGALFAIARKRAEMRPEMLEDTLPLELQVRLVGIAGEFKLPYVLAAPGERAGAAAVAVDRTSDPVPPMLWVAGGIGVTPFLSMLAAIAGSSSSSSASSGPEDVPAWKIKLAVATREPEVMVSLITAALERTAQGARPAVDLKVDIFATQPSTYTPPQYVADDGVRVVFEVHSGRIGADYFAGVSDLPAHAAYLCGPEDFERGILDMLKNEGYDKRVVRESFEY